MMQNIVMKKKVSYILALFLLLLLVIGIPTLCELLIQEDDKVIYWDGSVATEYHSGNGTINDPYIIETPSEFAYFAKMIEQGNNYENTYFKLNSDIYINNGVFELESDQPIYIKNYKKYYLKTGTNEYYSDANYQQKVGTVNIFSSITGFKGTLDGNDKHIYGLYLTGEKGKEIGLFHNLQGTIKNIYIENSLLIGGSNTSLITSAQAAIISDIRFSGNIKAQANTNSITKKIDEITIDNQTEHSITLPEITLPQGATNVNVSITGNYQTTNETNTLNINGTEYNNGAFAINTTELPTQLIVTPTSIEDSIQMTNINYTVTYDYSIASLISEAKDTIIENSYSKGKIISDNVASGMVGTVENKTTIKNSYTKTILNSKVIATGIIAETKKATLNIEKVYSSANITTGLQASALVGSIDSTTTGTIKNSFTTGTITAPTISNFIGGTNHSLTLENTYSTIQNLNTETNISPTIIGEQELLTRDFILNTMRFLEYNSENSLANENVWIINDNQLPYLYTSDEVGPNISITFDKYTWNSYVDSMNPIKNPSENKIEISYNDQQSAILKTEYYISSDYRTTPLNPEEIPWEIYNGEAITLSTAGNYTIYVKITDTSQNITYAHSDMIIYDNYASKVVDSVTDKQLDDYQNQITATSTIKYIFERNYETNQAAYENTDMLYLKGKIPVNTKIYLYDKQNQEIYYTKISQETENNLYNLGDFQKIGTEEITNFNNQVNNYYINNSFQEHFEFILDFKEANIEKNQNLTLELVVVDDNKNILTESNKQTISLIKQLTDNTPATPNIILESEVDGYFEFQKDSSLEIPLNTKIEYKKLNNKDIYDSEVQDGNLSLQISMLDSDKEELTSTEINKLAIAIGDKKYYFNNKGKLLVSNFQKIGTKSSFQIDCSGEPSGLKNGTYYIEIKELTLNKTIVTNKILIPVKVDNKNAIRDYNYKIVWDDNQVWNRTEEQSKDIMSHILYDGDLKDPKVKITLSKKVNFSSTSQEYQKLNINDYLKSPTTSDDSYQIEIAEKENNLELSFDVTKMSLGGYKLEYQLYDGNSYVGKDTKKFIVK